MSQITEEQALYDQNLLVDLNFSKFESHFKPPISLKQPGDGLIVRPLHLTDYHAGTEPHLWWGKRIAQLARVAPPLMLGIHLMLQGVRYSFCSTGMTLTKAWNKPLWLKSFGFIELLGQLTSTGDVSHKEFIERFQSMQECPNTYYVTVVEDTRLGRVVGSASLVLEQKFIHKCALRGRVEDVVVNDQYRGKQLGKLLMATLSLLAENLGVYKLTLDCKDNMVPFYQTFGYNKEAGNSNYMQIRFKL